MMVGIWRIDPKKHLHRHLESHDSTDGDTLFDFYDLNIATTQCTLYISKYISFLPCALLHQKVTIQLKSDGRNFISTSCLGLLAIM